MTQDNPGVPGSFAPGSRIAGYLLEEQIGQGGMAVVFRAHDERLDRTVALKILAPALAADDAFRQRFIRESRAAAAVDDPHIIPVFEAGESSGVLFIAMRYVRGGDVRSMLGQFGPLPPGRVAGIISQVAGALDAAHVRGLVHRDVKPANMLLDARSGAGGRPDHVYLSDFGLSKASLQATGLTGTGMFLGTLDYIAPEQIEGRPVDGRADQYALACAAYELITGSPPFVRNDAMAVMYAQLTEPPPPVSSRRPDLPTAVDRVFAQAMAKPAEQRFANCTAFAEALRDAFGIRPYDSGPESIPPHPMTQIVGGGGGAAGGGAGGAGGGGAGRGGRGSGPGGIDRAEATQPRDSEAGGPPTRFAGGGARDTSPDLTAAHWPSQQSPYGGQPPYGGGGGGGGDQGPYGGQGQYGQGGASSRRPWWRSPGAIAAAVVVLVILAGGGGYLGLHHSSKTSTTHTTALTLPGCTTAAAKGRSLKVPNSLVSVSGGDPFGIVSSQDGKFVFAVTPTTLQVFDKGAGTSLTPKFSYTIAAIGREAAGATITHDGKYLLVAAGSGMTVLSISSAETGAAPIVGTLTDPNISGKGQAVNVVVGKQGKFAFVTMKSGDVVAVFNLRKAISTGAFDSSDFVGAVRIGSNPLGMAISPDNHWLYVTSNAANDQQGTQQGLISVLNVQKAEVNPAQSVVAHVQAGCQPSRVITSADGKTVWVTARGSNAVLGFSASELQSSGSRHPLVAKVPVGQTPIGLALVNDGSRMVVADTDVNHTSRLADNLAVLNVQAALAGKPALLGFIQSGDLPREFGIVPGGRELLVSDNGSAQIQVVDLTKLP